MSNKEAAKTFLQMCARGEPAQAYERFVAPHFTHHNPYFPGDRASLLAAMEQAAVASPNRSFEVKRAFEDGDFVITHSHVVRAQEDGAGIAVVHILRFEHGKIAELWDVGQLLSKDSPNKNGPF